MRTLWISLTILFAFILGSCGSSRSATGNSPSLVPTSSYLTEIPTQILSLKSTEQPIQSINTPDFTDTTPLPVDSNEFVILVKQDLAKRLKISTDQITFLKSTEITWSDITQGCGPITGEALSKGRLTGYRIWLQAKGENYAYHIGLNDKIFLCPK